MARKKDTPQKAALREMMGNYMKENNVKVKDGTDVNSIMRDMMSIILEGALDQEMDEELGYSKYDYRNKETDNSRNGHSQKTMHTSYGDMEIDIPRDRKGEFEPQIVKKYQIRPVFRSRFKTSPVLIVKSNRITDQFLQHLQNGPGEIL